MMKKTRGVFLWILVCSVNAYALTTDELSNEMYLNQHWISHTTSFDVETKTQKIGSLHRRFLSIPLKYDFYDHSNHLLTTARARFASMNVYLDIFDKNKFPLGAVEEKIFTLFPSFTIYSADGVKLAHAEFNFWGTRVMVSEVLTDTIIAIMSRPFFRIKNDWTIKLKHKSLLIERNIDPSLLLTVLAFQGEREYWEEQDKNNHTLNRHSARPYGFKPIYEKKMTAYQHEYANELQSTELLPQDELETLTLNLEQAYEAHIHPEQSFMSIHDKIDGFVMFCLDLAHSEKTTTSTKKAIFYLLEQRFKGLVDV